MRITLVVTLLVASFSFSFTQPALVAPANGSTLGGLPTLSWNSVSGATSYSGEISLNAAFNQVVLWPGTVSTSYTYSTGLTTGLTYYWRMRANYSGGSFSPWSQVWSFTTSFLGPTLISPNNGASLPIKNPKLSWSSLTNANTYEGRVATDPSFTNLVAQPATGLTSFPLTTLAPNTTYYWKIRGVYTYNLGSSGVTNWSETRSFTTGTTGVPSITDLPIQYPTLLHNYPNPFNPSTTLRYHITFRSEVRLTILNILGQRVDNLVNEHQDAGQYSVVWNAHEPSGTYVAVLEVTSHEEPRKTYRSTTHLLLLR